MPAQTNGYENCPRPLARSYYAKRADAVARALIGKTLLRRTPDGLAGGTIVETEAYLSEDDPACHANRGPTKRNVTMFGPEGRLYVYTIHAKHCLNAVTEREGKGSAVLIRAIEPEWGIDLMKARRGYDSPLRLCRGPAMLCQALAIDLEQNGTDITESFDVWIGRAKRRLPDAVIGVSGRIGISQGTEMPLRFFVKDNRFVSGPKSLNT